MKRGKKNEDMTAEVQTAMKDLDRTMGEIKAGKIKT